MYCRKIHKNTIGFLSEPEFLNIFKDPRHRIHGIDSLWEINSVAELILGDMDSMWRKWRIKLVVVIWYCVQEKITSIRQHISNKKTIRQMSEVDEKSIPALKINIFWDMVKLISYLVPNQIQRNRFFPPLLVQ
jgi:hypothetical protein